MRHVTSVVGLNVLICDLIGQKLTSSTQEVNKLADTTFSSWAQCVFHTGPIDP